MIQISDKAIEMLTQIKKEQDKESFGLRIGVQTSCSGLSYYMGLQETSTENDKISEISGLKVFVDEVSAEYLNGAELDYAATEDGEGFVFKNPNAVEGCSGCSGSCG